MRTIIVFLLMLYGAVSARADYQISVVNFMATGSIEHWGRGLAGMLETDLVQASQNKFGNCGITIVDIRHREDILKELELQKGPGFDPASRVKTNLLDATYVIEGSVQADDAGDLYWTLQMREVASGRIVATDKAGAKLDQMLNEPAHIAERLLGQICKSYKLIGNAGPMAVSGTICSLAKTFTTKGSGGGMSVEFTYTPANANGGKVTYTGGGSGVKMAGAGTYTIKVDDKDGSLTHTHSGRVLTPGGGSATYTETFKLTPIPPC